MNHKPDETLNQFNNYRTALEREAWLAGYKKGQQEVRDKIQSFIDQHLTKPKHD